MATNIAAIGFIGRDIQNRKKVFTNALLYTLGTIIGYSVLGTLLILIIRQGTEIFQFQRAFTNWSERLTGPVIIITGIFMMGFFRFKTSLFSHFTERLEKSINPRRWWGSFLLGLLFANAFCPNTAVLFFGGLIPLAVTSPAGLTLPPIFALVTALPVCFIAWVVAFSLSSVGKYYNNLRLFEKWFRLVVAAVFIIVGTYLL